MVFGAVFTGIEGIASAVDNDENIDRKHAQATFIGPEGSGKSSLMHRLVHRRHQSHNASTGVANPVVIVDINIDNPSTFHAVTVLDPNDWEETKFDKSVVGQMHESVYALQQAQTKVSITPLTKATDSPPEPASVSDTTADVKDTDMIAAKPAFTGRPPVDDDIKQVISSAVRSHGGYINFNNLLRRKLSLYLRDAGGQVEFQEMVSLLVFGPSIFIFVFRADRDFKSTFQVGYRKSASESINCYTSSITTEEALLQCLASVYAMDTPKASLPNHKPCVFIVATHKDQLGPSADQKILQLNVYLKSLIVESGFENLVQYADRVKGQVLFCCG